MHLTHFSFPPFPFCLCSSCSLFGLSSFFPSFIVAILSAITPSTFSRRGKKDMSGNFAMVLSDMSLPGFLIVDVFFGNFLQQSDSPPPNFLAFLSQNPWPWNCPPPICQQVCLILDSSNLPASLSHSGLLKGGMRPTSLLELPRSLFLPGSAPQNLNNFEPTHSTYQKTNHCL